MMIWIRIVIVIKNVDDDGGDDVGDPNSDVLNDVKEGDYDACCD